MINPHLHPTVSEHEPSFTDIDCLLNLMSEHLYRHSQRVAVSATTIARYINKNPYPFSSELGLLSAIHLGGLCHDLGKITVPPQIIGDYRRHPLIGAELLKMKFDLFYENDQEAQIILDIVTKHHERPDGSGFPLQLKADDIPLTANICGIADWFDGLLEPKKFFPDSPQDVLRPLAGLAGKYFFECVIDCFECAWTELMAHYENWGYYRPPFRHSHLP